MHPEILAPDTARAFQNLSQVDWLRTFYLAGGTAVALRLGHRRSVDLDFFSEEPFNTLEMRQRLSECGEFQLDVESPGTIHGCLDGTKVSFLEYQYPLLESLEDYKHIAVASLKDLACMKLEAIAARGKKRDLIDLYEIAKQGNPLQEVMLWFGQKYRKLNYNQMHLIKSLSYFKDAESDPMPILLKKVEWNEVKRFFECEAQKLVCSHP